MSGTCDNIFFKKHVQNLHLLDPLIEGGASSRTGDTARGRAKKLVVVRFGFDDFARGAPIATRPLTHDAGIAVKII